MTLAAGAFTTIKFQLTSERLGLVTADGDAKSYAGAHEMIFSRGSGRDQIVRVTVLPDSVAASSAVPLLRPIWYSSDGADPVLGQTPQSLTVTADFNVGTTASLQIGVHGGHAMLSPARRVAVKANATDAIVEFAGGADFGALMGQTVALEMKLSNARVYMWWAL